jgi:CheY-like chemotaxis protein
VSRFLGADETREFVAALREVVEHGRQPQRATAPAERLGEVISTTLNASALRDPQGNVIGAIGILRDMRAYEEVLHDLEESRRELRDANQAKDRFLAVVSHELRTPLTAMLGWVRLLTTGMLDDATSARALPVIERNTKLLAQLIDDLLDVSRIVRGKLRLETAPSISSPSSSRRSRRSRASRTQEHRSQGRTDPSAGVAHRRPGPAAAGGVEPARERDQVHADRGASICAWSGPAPTRASPCAIPVGHQRRAAPAHFRPVPPGRRNETARRARTRAGRSCGTSWSCTTDGVGRERGRGTRRDAGGRAAGCRSEDVRAASTPTGGVPKARERSFRVINLTGRRILVVDDEARCARSSGGDPRPGRRGRRRVDSADEALQTLRRWRPDVLLSDIGMPGDDGYVLIRKVRALGAAEGGLVRALALTAYARSEDRTLALEAGFHAHIAKPVDPLELTALIAGLAPERRD